MTFSKNLVLIPVPVLVPFKVKVKVDVHVLRVFHLPLTILTHESSNARLQGLCGLFAFATYSPRHSPTSSPRGSPSHTFKSEVQGAFQACQSRCWWMARWVPGWVSGWVSDFVISFVYRPFSMVGWVWWGVTSKLAVYLNPKLFLQSKQPMG